MLFFIIELIVSFSLNSQPPYSSFTNPSLVNIYLLIFNTLHVVITMIGTHFITLCIFYIIMVQGNPIQINVINELSHK